jgi:hypothetical protein
MIEPLGLGNRARFRETRDPSGSTPRHATGSAASVKALRCDGDEGGLQSRNTRIRTGDPPLGRNDALPLVVCEEKISFRSSPALLAA